MEIIPTEIKGVYIIKNKILNDKRGSFCKVFHKNDFKKFNLSTRFKESYYSTSKKNVIRGMHFQIPPYDHEKLIYVPKGKVIDVVLDLRQGSKTFGKYRSFEISENNRYSIYIPKGCAHGFKSCEDNTILVNSTSTVYNPNYEDGVRWDSFGMNWEVENPIVSKKDKGLKSFLDFKTPFKE